MNEKKSSISDAARLLKWRLDPQELKRKYREERDKRLRRDGYSQYIEARGEFAHYAEDVNAEKKFSRPPLCEDVGVVIIGGGFGGLLAGARLHQAGISDVSIIERRGDFGGV